VVFWWLSLPQYGGYVEQVIHRYLDCGDLHNGFARVKCKDYGHGSKARAVKFGAWLSQISIDNKQNLNYSTAFCAIRFFWTVIPVLTGQ